MVDDVVEVKVAEEDVVLETEDVAVLDVELVAV